MAKNTQLSNTIANAQADALASMLDAGLLRIYNGTQPATADTAVTTQTLLAELALATPSAPAASAGVITFTGPLSATAVATGTATWFRLLTAGAAAVLDGTVGVTADVPNLELSSVSIAAGAAVSVTSLQHTVAKAVSGL